MKNQSILAFLIMLICLATVSISFAESMAVGFSGTEMRSKPNAMDSKVISKLTLYSPLKVIEKGTDYYMVKDYRGHSGWVHRSLLNNTQCVVVTGDSPNVRQGPGTNHSVAFQLPKGTTAQLIERQDEWLYIQTTEGQKGWIADFLVWGE